jgi:hypothetical protein
VSLSRCFGQGLVGRRSFFGEAVEDGPGTSREKVGGESSQTSRCQAPTLGEGQVTAVTAGGGSVGVERPMGLEVAVDGQPNRQHHLNPIRRLVITTFATGSHPLRYQR